MQTKGSKAPSFQFWIFYFVIIFPSPHPKIQKGEISDQKVPGTYLSQGLCEKKIITLVFNAAKEKFSPLHFRAAIKCHVLPRREKGVLLTVVEKHFMAPPGEGGSRMGTLRRACRFGPFWALLSGPLIPPEAPTMGLMVRLEKGCSFPIKALSLSLSF